MQDQFTKELTWDSSSDRDIDFKRKYSRKYYDYAVRWVNNKVRFHQTKQSSYKIKSWVAKAGMMKEKIFPSQNI
jgi:hypothetical protein